MFLKSFMDAEMKTLLIIILAVGVTGCATITEQAQNVQVHGQGSTLVEDCKKLGPVQVKVNGLTKLSPNDVYIQAKNDIRHMAWEKYGADTVVLLNQEMSVYSRNTTIQGMAMKCYSN